MAENRIAVGLDIGTSVIRVAIGEYDDEKVILLGTDDIDEGAYTPDYLRRPDSVK